jgi:hypothetical protein
VVSPWPVDANGTGKTIELKNPELDNSIGMNWQAITPGGTPGRVNSVAVVPTNNFVAKAVETKMDCFPSPFRDFTTIYFTIADEGHYRLEVIDMQGKTVKVLADQNLSNGSYWIDWTAGSVPPGVYTIRISSNKVITTRKVIKIQN